MFSNTAKSLFLAMTLLVQAAQAAPVFSIFELGIADGQNARYDAVARQNISASVRDEAGTLAMFSLKNAQDENTAYMVELYADEAAYQAHRAGAGYAAFLKAAPQILGDKKIKPDLIPQFWGDKPVKQTAATRVNLVG